MCYLFMMQDEKSLLVHWDRSDHMGKKWLADCTSCIFFHFSHMWCTPPRMSGWSLRQDSGVRTDTSCDLLQSLSQTFQETSVRGVQLCMASVIALGLVLNIPTMSELWLLASCGPKKKRQTTDHRERCLIVASSHRISGCRHSKAAVSTKGVRSATTLSMVCVSLSFFKNAVFLALSF